MVKDGTGGYLLNSERSFALMCTSESELPSSDAVEAVPAVLPRAGSWKVLRQATSHICWG